MSDDRSVLEALRRALHSEPHVRPTQGPIHLVFAESELTMEGEVDHIAGKKLALEAAARVPGVDTIVDRLHVRPATLMGDGDIRDKCGTRCWKRSRLLRARFASGTRGTLETMREPADAVGTIDVRVDGYGIVTLDGDVPGPGQKRLAGVLAWWVPGSHDVFNGIGVTPPEQDSEAAVTDAVLQVLEKDPFVNSESIRIYTRRAVVTLDGTVPREAEMKLAEDDAWYVFGVDKVVNRLTVRM